MFRPFLYRFFSVYLFLLFFANVAHGSSRLGTSKGGGSSVFSLFNLKEKSRFWSESVLRTGFDDLESSVPLKESMENYTKAGTIANYLKLLEVDSLYLPIPVNFIFIGFEGKGNQGFELHPEELERWFTKIDHIFQHSRIPQIGEVLTPFYKISIDREQYHHLPLISHVNFNFSAHAIQMGEKVTSIFEHAINVLSRKDDVPHTGDEEAGLWQVDVDMMATLFDSLVDYLQLQDAYNIFVLNPKRDPKRAKYGYRRGLSESEINFLKEDKALQSRILQSGSVPDSDLALDKIKRPLYAKHPMAKFSWTVTEETDTVEWYNRCLEALNNIEKLYSGKDTSNIIHGKVMKFLSGKNEDLKLLLEKNLRSGDLSGFHADCLTDMWIGKERWAFIDLSAGPFSWGPAVGGEGVRTELSLPSVDKTIGAVEEKDTTSGSSVQEAAPTSVTATNSSGGDVTSLQITSHKLNGKNFLLWSQSVLMVIRGRGKMGYLTGDIPRPATTDASYENWELNNSIVMSWLINSMEPHISRTYIFLRTAKAIWSAVKENYSDLENASQVFEIKNKLKDVRQGSLEVTEYYNLLQAWWQELDMYYEADWGDLDTNVKLKTHLEKERLYEFLAGVNRDLDEVRGRILGRRPLPSIEEAFAEVRREESRKKVMLGRQQDSEVTIVGGRPAETMALVTKRGPPDQKQRPRCSYCNKLGHTQDRCWSRHEISEDEAEDRLQEAIQEKFAVFGDKDHNAIDILLAEIDIYELFAFKHCKGRRIKLALCDELDERMQDLKTELESFEGEEYEESHKSKAVDALKRMEKWNLFSDTHEDSQNYTVARDTFLAHFGSTLWGSMRHIISPSLAVGAFHYYEKISFQLFFITQERFRTIKQLPVDLKSLMDGLSSLVLPSQKVMFSQHMLPLSEDPALAMAFSVARRAAAVPLLLVNGTYRKTVRSFLDSSILQHQLKRLNDQGSLKGSHAHSRSTLEIPIFWFIHGDALLVDKHYQAKALSDMVVVVQSEQSSFESHLQCNGQSLLLDLRRPIKAALAAVSEHLAGLLPLHLVYSHAHENAIEDWIWSVGCNPLSVTSQGWHISKFHSDTIARSYIITALEESIQVVNTAIYALVKEQTSERTFKVFQPMERDLLNKYNYVVSLWRRISTTAGELRHDNAMGLLHTLEEASKGFAEYVNSTVANLRPIHCTRQRKVDVEFDLTTVPVFVILIILLWAALRPGKPKPKIN